MILAPHNRCQGRCSTPCSPLSSSVDMSLSHQPFPFLSPPCRDCFCVLDSQTVVTLSLSPLYWARPFHLNHTSILKFKRLCLSEVFRWVQFWLCKTLINNSCIKMGLRHLSFVRWLKAIYLLVPKGVGVSLKKPKELLTHCIFFLCPQILMSVRRRCTTASPTRCASTCPAAIAVTVYQASPEWTSTLAPVRLHARKYATDSL